jgi:hypothetical protein
MIRSAAIVVAMTTLTVAPVPAAPLDDKVRSEIAIHLLASSTNARNGRAEEALKSCSEAKSYAARYDQDPLIGGRIEMCFGLAAIFRKDKSAACAAYARALPLLTRVKPPEGAFDLDQAKRRRRELGCR